MAMELYPLNIKLKSHVCSRSIFLTANKHGLWAPGMKATAYQGTNQPITDQADIYFTLELNPTTTVIENTSNLNNFK